MQRRTATSVGVVGFLAMAFAASWIATEQDTPKGLKNTPNNRADVVYLGSAGVVFQSRSNNCGIAALMMVLDHYGMKFSQGELERGAKLEFGATSLLTLRELAKSAGLEADGWKLSYKDLERIQFPTIIFIENHHFVVVDSVDASGALFVRDPSVGRLRIPRTRAIEIWNGETLVITRDRR